MSMPSANSFLSVLFMVRKNWICEKKKKKFLFMCSSQHLNLFYPPSLGDSLNSCLVAVIAVDPEVLKEWAASEGIKVVPLSTVRFEHFLCFHTK